MNSTKYYLPSPSGWPIRASIALLCLLAGVANWLHSHWFGPYLTMLGFIILIYVIYGWFGTVIQENREGKLQSHQVERSFILCMLWFIFTEVMFFGTFFTALFYVRLFVLPDLGGETSITHILLWPNFQVAWPLMTNPDPSTYIGPLQSMGAWGISTINTFVLLMSGVTVTIAHYSLLKNRRTLMLWAQFVTILLGLTFLILQLNEYGAAYFEKGLTLASGIYGTTFFMLTGFHGLHVTIGTIGLMVILYRMFKKDFTAQNHFGFVAVSWYWHFVDVIWLLLFVFVYWL
ncbi:MAG: MFS transporter [Gammaproteobacteria bacterium RIFCSPHIGHO2_12_FULL_38_14]|nr:MAG: MFS transporter [Gammaproteobacteria bacterium RIFCSPHIGHO2_12_FULL_38_14]